MNWPGLQRLLSPSSLGNCLKWWLGWKRDHGCCHWQLTIMESRLCQMLRELFWVSGRGSGQWQRGLKEWASGSWCCSLLHVPLVSDGSGVRLCAKLWEWHACLPCSLLAVGKNPWEYLWYWTLNGELRSCPELEIPHQISSWVFWFVFLGGVCWFVCLF